ncbi:hypothetical protein MF672_009655 [Actinomadura sp. ATCC 31491]|uniref:Uncharacterized protein n=1 Tax=Actinomadura luzonensis TaxID=2805427 RepID=A0ABT0FP15_9ACTN|nr:hypothetical protein [Actinomadura luzonensis]MCK2214052.1 hypothetical protein [Actinomadura luzonensis]
MDLDRRRVQTAVLGSPESDHPLSLPTDRVEAFAYLSRYRGQEFYCGQLLGGCGWRLMDKLYKDRVCHFAHYPDPHGHAPECERRYAGADSADHLYIHRGLTTRFGQLGKKQRFNGRMEGGECIDLLVTPRRARSAIKVQFVNLSAKEWADEDEDLRRRLGRVDWVVGPRASTTAGYLIDRDGYALHVRCIPRERNRIVEIGTETRDGDLAWASVDDCEITERGIVTPLLRKTRSSNPRGESSPQPVSEPSKPAMDPRRLAIYQEVRAGCVKLVQDIEEAKGAGDLATARLYVREFRLTLVRVSLFNPDFAQEVRQLKSYEAWVAHEQNARKVAKYQEQRTQTLGLTQQRRARLRDIVKLLRGAQAAGDRALGRELEAEGRELLKMLKTRKTYKEDRKVLDRAARWLDVSAAPFKPETPPPAPQPQVGGAEGLGERILAKLKAVAADQKTIDWQQLLGKEWEWTSSKKRLEALVWVDDVDDKSRPLLSALVTQPQGRLDPEFRQILAALGFAVPQTDQALELIWRREVDRAHACFAKQPRPIPDRLVPRADQ